MVAQRAREVYAPTGDVGWLGNSATIVGATSQWGDDDLGTYATIRGRYGTEVLDLWTIAQVLLPPNPDLIEVENPRLAVWYKATADTSLPMQVSISAAGSGSYLLTTPFFHGTATTPAHTSEGMTAPDGWSIVELFTNGSTVAGTMSSWRTNGLVLEFETGVIDPAEAPGGDVTYSWTVYEARIVIYTDALLTAPPCRLFPRGDGLGVGGGRRYPPPKSQQRSSRRFGYY